MNTTQQAEELYDAIDNIAIGYDIETGLPPAKTTPGIQITDLIAAALTSASEEERERLAAENARKDAALREIMIGKIQEDNEHPQGPWFSMVSRFMRIASAALKEST